MASKTISAEKSHNEPKNIAKIHYFFPNLTLLAISRKVNSIILILIVALMTLNEFDGVQNPSEGVQKDIQKPFSWFIAIYFFWVGGLSWTVFSSVSNSYDYFEAKFPNDNVSFLFPIGPYFGNIIIIVLITHLSVFLSYHIRIMIPLIAFIIIGVILPFEAYFLADTTFGICFIMVLLGLLGFFSNMCYASICGFTSQVGRDFTTYFMIGVASFSLLMSLTKEAILLIYQPTDDGEIGNILVYFGFATALVVIGMILHVLFMNSDYYRIYFEPIITQNSSSLKQSNQEIELGLVDSTTNVARPPKRNLKTLFQIFMDSKLQNFLMFLTCIQHNTFFPGVMLLKPVPEIANHTKTVTMITTFNVLYILGKKLGQYRRYYSVKTVIMVAIFRFFLIGALIVQVLEPNAPIIGSISFGYVIIGLFGLSYGFSIVSLFVLIPEDFPPNKKEISGFVGVVGNNIGTVIGAFSALAFKNL